MLNPLLLRRNLGAHLPLIPVLCPPPCGDGSSVPDDKDKELRNLSTLLEKKNGDATALAAELLGENARLREERRNLRTANTNLEAKVPKDGVKLLTPELEKELGDYKAEGSLEEFKKAKSDAKTLAEENTGLKETNAKNEHLRGLAEVAGEMKYKLSVLQKLDADTPGLEYFKKTVNVDGKAIEVQHVRYKEGDGANAVTKESPLSEFAASNAAWKDFLPALQVGQEQNGDGTRHVAQGGGTGQPSDKSFFDRIRQEEADKKKEGGVLNPQQEAQRRMGMMPSGTAPTTN